MSDQDVVDLTRRLFRAATVLGDDVRRSTRLGPSDRSALQALDEAAQGPLRVSDLTSRLGLSSAATTALVDRLETAGLVRRERDAGDRRQVRVVLQPAARSVGEELLAPWGRRMQRAATTLDPEEQRAVVRYLRLLLDDSG